jgi:hypothetical protein
MSGTLIAESKAKNAELERFTHTVSHELKSSIPKLITTREDKLCSRESGPSLPPRSSQMTKT